jgi:hypothetical protein
LVSTSQVTETRPVDPLLNLTGSLPRIDGDVSSLVVDRSEPFGFPDPVKSFPDERI